MTELDQSLEIARLNPSQANFFYDCFLNSFLFIPAQRADNQEGSWNEIKQTERFFPLYLRKGEVRAIPVFDQLDRLQAWANTKVFDYIILPGHLFLKVIARDVDILLNEETDWRHHLTCEILQQLRNSVKPVLPS